MLVCCGLAIASLLQAQQITFSARVADAESGEPLVFASVGIAGRSIGTITNLQGDFDFHFPSAYRNDILTISMLGYHTYEAPIWSLLQDTARTILIQRSVFVLGEVIVKDSLTGGDILRIAIDRIPDNYPTSPFLLDAFYRDIKKVGGPAVSLLEAAVKIYDEDYAEPRNKYKLKERVGLQEVRRSLGYDNKFTSYFDEGNLLEDLLLHNNVRYHLFSPQIFEGLVRRPESFYHGEPVFVLEQTESYKLKVYVAKSNYGILRIEYEDHGEQPLGRKKGLDSRFISLHKVIDFRPFKGKLYLNYMTLHSAINWYNPNDGSTRFETTLDQQLLINEIIPEPEERVSISGKMKAYGLQYQHAGYNREFWALYNVIKESPVDQKIIRDLERELPLERQFEDN